MPRNRIEDADFSIIAEELGISASDVKRAVYSFFGIIVREARNLPFDDSTRIYTRERFDDFAKVRNIPSIGRMGPVYSRYLKWRGNESKNQTQVNRSSCRAMIPQDEIEHIAEDILAGRTPSPVVKQKTVDIYKRIWMIGRDKKRLARQVITKEDKDGIQD